MLDYHGEIGLQYNPIAIAQWGLGNHDLFHRTGSDERKEKFLKASEWLLQSPGAESLWRLDLEPSFRLGIS